MFKLESQTCEVASASNHVGIDDSVVRDVVSVEKDLDAAPYRLDNTNVDDHRRVSYRIAELEWPSYVGSSIAVATASATVLWFSSLLSTTIQVASMTPQTVRGLHIGLASVVGEWLEAMGSHSQRC